MYQLNSVILGDCREVLPKLPAASFDAIITDPVYPGAIRSYGYWTEEAWLEMMQEVVREAHRLLKPSGSAVFILQPNSEKVGKMRSWLWKFMVFCCQESNIVQDVYWWAYTSPPVVHCRQNIGLMRPSLKYCIWLGAPDCYRNQDAILLEESTTNRAKRESNRIKAIRETHSSRFSTNDYNTVRSAERRGGVTPFNVLPIPQDNLLPFSNANSVSSGGAHGHPASTPIALLSWWLNYIVPEGGTVLDAFFGSGTLGEAAMRHGRQFVGIEIMPEYVELARARLGLSS